MYHENQMFILYMYIIQQYHLLYHEKRKFLKTPKHVLTLDK